MTTVVTGAGLIGTAFAQNAVARGEKVVFVDPEPRADFLKLKLGDKGYALARYDVRDLPNLIATIKEHGADTVVHTAGLIGNRVQQSLSANPFDGAVYLFRGRRGRSLKALWHDGVALSLLVRRLEHGHFPWPMTPTGSVTLSPAQASLLLEGLEWRTAQRAWRPTAA